MLYFNEFVHITTKCIMIEGAISMNLATCFVYILVFSFYNMQILFFQFCAEINLVLNVFITSLSASTNIISRYSFQKIFLKPPCSKCKMYIHMHEYDVRRNFQVNLISQDSLVVFGNNWICCIRFREKM